MLRKFEPFTPKYFNKYRHLPGHVHSTITNYQNKINDLADAPVSVIVGGTLTTISAKFIDHSENTVGIKIMGILCGGTIAGIGMINVGRYFWLKRERRRFIAKQEELWKYEQNLLNQPPTII